MWSSGHGCGPSGSSAAAPSVSAAISFSISSSLSRRLSPPPQTAQNLHNPLRLYPNPSTTSRYGRARAQSWERAALHDRNGTLTTYTITTHTSSYLS